jgi:hypothetical protein
MSPLHLSYLQKEICSHLSDFWLFISNKTNIKLRHLVNTDRSCRHVLYQRQSSNGIPFYSQHCSEYRKYSNMDDQYLTHVRFYIIFIIHNSPIAHTYIIDTNSSFFSCSIFFLQVRAALACTHRNMVQSA